AGWSPKLPMPAGRSPAGTGIGAVYALGVFSGVASACCAPVLIGVTVLAGATASFPTALAVAGTYVVGMVAPLLIMSMGWERLGTRAARALQARRVPLLPGATPPANTAPPADTGPPADTVQPAALVPDGCRTDQDASRATGTPNGDLNAPAGVLAGPTHSDEDQQP